MRPQVHLLPPPPPPYLSSIPSTHLLSASPPSTTTMLISLCRTTVPVRYSWLALASTLNFLAGLVRFLILQHTNDGTDILENLRGATNNQRGKQWPHLLATNSFSCRPGMLRLVSYIGLQERKAMATPSRPRQHFTHIMGGNVFYFYELLMTNIQCSK